MITNQWGQGRKPHPHQKKKIMKKVYILAKQQRTYSTTASVMQPARMERYVHEFEDEGFDCCKPSKIVSVWSQAKDAYEHMTSRYNDQWEWFNEYKKDGSDQITWEVFHIYEESVM